MNAASPPEYDWEEWMQGLATGDQEICRQFWKAYGSRLGLIAKRHLPSKLKPRVEPEDIVQSACRTFFRRIQDGKIELVDGDLLWPYLCAITVNKVRLQARFHGRQRRSPDREQRLGLGKEATGMTAGDLVGDGLSPDESAAFAEQLHRLLADMDETECQVIQLKLEQYSNHEIAERLLCSERTVRRIINRLRERLKDSLLESTRD